MFGYIFNLFNTDKKQHRIEEIEKAKKLALEAVIKEEKRKKSSKSATATSNYVWLDVVPTPTSGFASDGVKVVYTESNFAGHGGSFGGGGASGSWDSDSSSSSSSSSDSSSSSSSD